MIQKTKRLLNRQHQFVFVLSTQPSYKSFAFLLAFEPKEQTNWKEKTLKTKKQIERKFLVYPIGYVAIVAVFML